MGSEVKANYSDTASAEIETAQYITRLVWGKRLVRGKYRLVIVTLIL